MGGNHSPGPLCLDRLDSEPGAAEPGFEGGGRPRSGSPAVPAGMQLGGPNMAHSMASEQGRRLLHGQELSQGLLPTGGVGFRLVPVDVPRLYYSV